MAWKSGSKLKIESGEVWNFEKKIYFFNNVIVKDFWRAKATKKIVSNLIKENLRYADFNFTFLLWGQRLFRKLCSQIFNKNVL